MDPDKIQAGKKYLIESEGHVSEVLPRSLSVDQPGSWMCVRSGDGKLFTVAPQNFCCEIAASK